MLSSVRASLRSSALAAGFVGLALWLALPVQGREPAATQTAAEMMQQAHDGRAVWTDFPGFESRVRCSVDGGVVEGRVSVARDGVVRLDLPEDSRFGWVQRTLDSLIGHRLSDGEAITNVEFADDQADHPQGRLIRAIDTPDHSLWRAKGDVLMEVHRVGKESRFIISVSDVWRTADHKHLPKDFVVTTWKLPAGQIESVRQVRQEWARIGNLDLPARHLAIQDRSDGTRVTYQIEFLDHLPAAKTVQK